MASSIENRNASHIKNVVVEVFRGADEHQWALIAKHLMPNVWMNYALEEDSSPTLLTAERIVASWKQILPGFSYTQHQLNNFQTNDNDHEATVLCYGQILHFLPHQKGSTWQVFGTYQFHLVYDQGNWKIDSIAFQYKFQDGNLELPRLASLAMQQTQSIKL